MWNIYARKHNFKDGVVELSGDRHNSIGSVAVVIGAHVEGGDGEVVKRFDICVDTYMGKASVARARQQLSLIHI